MVAPGPKRRTDKPTGENRAIGMIGVGLISIFAFAMGWLWKPSNALLRHDNGVFVRVPVDGEMRDVYIHKGGAAYLMVPAKLTGKQR